MSAPQDLAGLPLILPGRPNASRRLLDGWLSRRGIRLNVRMEVDDHLIIRALMRDGLGFSLLTQGAFLADLRARGAAGLAVPSARVLGVGADGSAG